MNNFPGKLFHKTPAWVADTAVFHIRIRCDATAGTNLTDDTCSKGLLHATREYVRLGLWSCPLFLLMPDHVHALLSFGRDRGMSDVVRNWKRGTSRLHGVRWQSNFFDHRIRNATEFTEKFVYIERNPVANGLCMSPEEWPHRISCAYAEQITKF